MRVVYLNLECILQITRCTFFTIFTYPYTCNKVWCIKKRTKHTMSLWLYCSFFGLYVWAPNISHFKGLDMRNLQYAIRIYQKSHYKVTMQWQFIFGSIFNQTLLFQFKGIGGSTICLWAIINFRINDFCWCIDGLLNV